MKQKKCKNCKGTGFIPLGEGIKGIKDCPVCKGTGKIETEPREKQIAELEEKISVLLSCENCPENKDGLICRKEYENKCLAQKIQFIKELQQENAELKAQIEKKMEEIRTDNTETLKNALKRIAELEKENAELKEEMNAKQVVLNDFKSRVETVTDRFNKKSSQLTKAKEIIEELYNIIPASMSDYAKEPMEHARKFMTEE